MTVQPARPNAMALGTRLRNDSLTGDRSDRPLLAVLLSSSRAPAGHGFPSMGCSQQYIKLRFIDSYKFLNTSLDKLASFLSTDQLKILRSKFESLSTEDFNLLTRKGVFPYEYLDCANKLQDPCLPTRESFYSSLTGETVSETDYTHAETVWQRFGIRTSGEYSDLYLKTDVLLLADIFENFCESCIKSYGLDSAHYYTLPGFT